MENNINLDYFFENLFSNKIHNETKLNILAKLERESTLHIWIEKYHPKYYSGHVKNDRMKVMTINLVIDLKLV